jgi:hypothetical protein
VRPGPRELKYAVLHLMSGIDLILKARLHEHDPAQLYQDPAQFSDAGYATGDFTGPKTKEILKRLGSAGVSLTSARKAELEQLRKKRNRAEHFHLEDTVAAISAITARTLGFALDFIAGVFDANALSATASSQLEEIRAALPGLEHFVADHHDSIAGKLARPRRPRSSSARPARRRPPCSTTERPACSAAPARRRRRALTTTRTRCLTRTAMRATSRALLGSSPRVRSARPRHSSTGVRAVTLSPHISGCASPAATHGERAASAKCDRCGELISAGEDEMSICGDCFNALVAKD